MRAVLILILALFCCDALAIDIITMPSANQFKGGEVEFGSYYAKFETSASAPQHAYLEEVAVGVTDALEIDTYFVDIDGDKDSAIVSAYIKCVRQTQKLPDVSIGAWNITGSSTSNIPGLSDTADDTSYFIVTAKTIPLSKNLTGPPFARLHLSWGTGDHTVLGVERHDGFFGGVQWRMTNHFGVTAVYDGAQWLTGIGYGPEKYGLAVRCGTVGSDQWWGGLSYRFKPW